MLDPRFNSLDHTDACVVVLHRDAQRENVLATVYEQHGKTTLFLAAAARSVVFLEQPGCVNIPLFCAAI